MALPPLYKYLDVEGAKLTLGNKTFKHAKPTDFNDTEDLTIQSMFPQDTEAALKMLSAGFTDVILRHLNESATCSSPIKEKVALIQGAFRANPGAAEVVKAELAKEGAKPIFDVEHMRAQAAAFVKDINEHMQLYRVLCVTTLKDSEQMWSNYAERHKGIALRIEPNLAKDSKFKLFRPVTYCEKRPPLYEDTLDFVAGSLFGDQELRLKVMLERIVCAKTLEWEHESEYRLAIPMLKGEEPWNTLHYHPEEITELYLGLAMEKAVADEIQSKANAVNPGIAVFQVKRSGMGKLGFDRVDR
jgi:hypothetical protein